MSKPCAAATCTMAVSAEEFSWLVSHLREVVTASPAAWAGKGMTLSQLTALHLIAAQEPVTLTDLAQALDTGLPATSAMVNRLSSIGLVCSVPDPQNRRRIQLTIAARAKPMVGHVDLHTAKRIQAALNGMGSQVRYHLIDVLRETVRRSADQPMQSSSCL
ncbi:MAG TPA: MarR family transcriptional regulator [Pseudonocardiaceae bacterium]|nr:MarR family transcriptional regulator [Pseudonocardiaceae bacterium]